MLDLKVNIFVSCLFTISNLTKYFLPKHISQPNQIFHSFSVWFYIVLSEILPTFGYTWTYRTIPEKELKKFSLEFYLIEFSFKISYLFCEIELHTRPHWVFRENKMADYELWFHFFLKSNIILNRVVYKYFVKLGKN